MNTSFKTLRASLVAVGLLLGASVPAHAGLINGGFENPVIAPTSYIITNQSNVPGWLTTSSDSNIEIWSTGYNNASGGPVPSYEGNQFAEINATQFATLYQDVSGIGAGLKLGFQFAHRGRAGVDTMRLTITDLGLDNVLGGGNDTVLFTDLYSDGNTAWGFYTNPFPILALGNNVRFAYEAVTAAGSISIGNFLDAVDFGVGVGEPVPETAPFALMGLGLAALRLARRRIK